MTTPRRPGRPREPHVIARDEAVYQQIAAGTTSRSALAMTTGYDRDAIYLSCKRLQSAGRIQQALSPSGTIGWIPTTRDQT